MATNGNESNEKVNTDIITLTRFLTEEQSKHKEATGDFTYVSLQKYKKSQANVFDPLPDFYAMPFNSHSRVLPTIFEEQL